MLELQEIVDINEFRRRAGKLGLVVRAPNSSGIACVWRTTNAVLEDHVRKLAASEAVCELQKCVVKCSTLRVLLVETLEAAVVPLHSVVTAPSAASVSMSAAQSSMGLYSL